MDRCWCCGEAVVGSGRFRCSFCDEIHCSDHRLPENHDCPAPAVTAAASVPLSDAARSAAEKAPKERSRGVSRQQPQKTPCEECGRPCPTEQEYCSPCQKDVRDRKRRPATAEEIREHRRKYDPAFDPPEPPGRMERIRAALPSFSRLVVLAVLVGVALWYLGFVDVSAAL